jgi:hypothetical protein
MLENTRIYRKHKNCNMRVEVGPFGPHYAKLICTKHNKQIQWVSKEAAELILDLEKHTL